MRRTIFLIAYLLLQTITLQAQPAAVQKVSNSVFTLTTFDKDGHLLSSSQGVFITPDGEGISTWKPFIGAYRAVVCDAKGKQADVTALIGANEIYDICRFRVATPETAIPLSPSMSPNNQVWAVPYTQKKAECIPLTISSVETFMDKYSYYILSSSVAENMVGCPVVNAKGQLIGILQHSAASSDCHSTDATLTNSFVVNGLSVGDPTLSQSHICLDIPKDESQASIFLMMAKERSDSLLYRQYIDAFIQKHPLLLDGYTARAQEYMQDNLFDEAANTMEYAIKQLPDKAGIHAEYAKLIYQKEIFKPEIPYEGWSLGKALEEATTAYSLSKEPAYLHQQAQIIYSQGEYQKAYDIFIGLTKTPYRNSELFLEAAQCKSQLQAGSNEVIELLDSAVATCPSPLSQLSAPYILARGHAYHTNEEYRKALRDYNQYDSLMYNRASHDFYYMKFKCETQVKQYQQALNDIAHAIVLNPAEPSYYAEMASLQLRVNLLEEAVKTCDMCLQSVPDYPDAHLIKGIALINSHQKSAGLQSLEKAKELGDERAQPLIEKYQ